MLVCVIRHGARCARIVRIGPAWLTADQPGVATATAAHKRPAPTTVSPCHRRAYSDLVVTWRRLAFYRTIFYSCTVDTTPCRVCCFG